MKRNKVEGRTSVTYIKALSHKLPRGINQDDWFLERYSNTDPDVYETEILIATTENVYLFISYHMLTLNNVKTINFVRFIFITAVTMKNTIFWNVTPCIW
jgi:hypothetical protein